MESRDFFISYTQEDKMMAEWVGKTLKDHGYTVYLQTWDNPPGESFITWIDRAIESSQHFIAIWSKAYSQSAWCKEELETAFERKVKGEIGKFLPVRVEQYPLPPLFRRYNRVELFAVDKAEQTVRLLKAVGYQKLRNNPQDTLDRTECLSAGELNQRGNDYYHGRGAEQNYLKAKECYEQAALMGHSCALKNLGYLYGNGLGVTQNYRKARDYFERAATEGNADAYYNLGVIYENGWGVKIDLEKAAKYYRMIGESVDYPHKQMRK